MKRIITITASIVLMAFACNKEETKLIVDTAGIPHTSGKLEGEADSVKAELFSKICLSEKQLQALRRSPKFKDLNPVSASDPVHQ